MNYSNLPFTPVNPDRTVHLLAATINAAYPEAVDPFKVRDDMLPRLVRKVLELADIPFPLGVLQVSDCHLADMARATVKHVTSSNPTRDTDADIPGMLRTTVVSLGGYDPGILPGDLLPGLWSYWAGYVLGGGGDSTPEDAILYNGQPILYNGQYPLFSAQP